MLVFCSHQGGVPPAVRFLTPPLGIVRLEGGEYISEYELAFPETAWDVGYLTHLYFHLHLIKPTKAEWTLKVKGETALDHVVFWSAVLTSR